jgi:hypothetical protein
MHKSKKLLIDRDPVMPVSERHGLSWHLKQIAKGGVGLLGLTTIGGLGYFAWKFFSRRGGRMSSETTLQAESGRGLSKYEAREKGTSSQSTNIASKSTKTGLATAKQEKLIELGTVDFYEPTQLKEFSATTLSQASIHSIEQTADGGYIAAGGGCIAAGTGYSDSLILKLNSTSDIAWAKSFDNGAPPNTAYSIQQTADNGYIVAGMTKNQTYEALVFKLDEFGNKVWAKTFSDPLGVNAVSIQQTADGGYIVVGTNQVKSLDMTYLCVLILKLDDKGNKVWVKNFIGPAPQAIQQTADHGYIIVALGNGYNEKSIILKLDNVGNKVWAKTLSCSDFSYMFFPVQQTFDGGYIVVCKGDDDGDVIILKLDDTGNKIWAKTLGCSDSCYARSIQQTTDGGYITAGSIDIGKNKALIFKLDEAGNKVWVKSFGNIYEEEIFSVRQTINGGYIAAGEVVKESDYTVHHWAFVLKLDANGIAARTGCGGQDVSLDVVNTVSFTVEETTLFAQETSLTQAAADSFKLADWNQPGTIIICPSDLTLTANTLTIDEGGSVILTTANINVGEQKQSASNLTISISNIQHGQFERISAVGTAITSFNLQELQDSQIRFIHDGGIHPPSYAVQISHGMETTVPSVATINFELSLWLTFGLPCAVVAAVAGYVWRKHSHKTFRKNFPFADYLRTFAKLPKVNNFYSKTGRSYINMIYGVPTEVDDWTMGDIKVDGIAIKLDGLLYKLYQKERYEFPLTLPQERALAETVGKAIREILIDEAAKASNKRTKITLAKIQEQLEDIADKTPTSSTSLILSQIPEINQSELTEEEQESSLAAPVQRYMQSVMSKAGEEHAPLLRLRR